MKKPIYIIGTGLSHNGSAVLLKDGHICVAVEKERLSRIKHDGGNDTLAIQYCLEAEGIELKDVSLVVQSANFDIPNRERFKGKRIFSEENNIKIITISHHIAHAYSAVGISPFSECAVIVIDGCGSPLNQYLELHPDQLSNIDSIFINETQMLCEKDSFYHFYDNKLNPLFKDFSKMEELTNEYIEMPTTKHSIGGFYAAISKYIFGDIEDVGKLMGLAPYGKSNKFNFEAFEFVSECLFVKDEWKNNFTNPSKGYDYFMEHFSYYADVAKWAQEQVEKAVLSCINFRLKKFPHKNLCYSGGVALNAVANSKLQDSLPNHNIFFEPAAGDNGLAIGCAFYGWISYLKMPKLPHDGNTCFGRKYIQEEIDEVVNSERNKDLKKKMYFNEQELIKYCAEKLNSGKTVAWFQSGCEFGPRSLGRRSILAHPGIENMKNHINNNIKFREDFRPFAPAVLNDKVNDYFEVGRESPYMILVDKTRSKYTKQLVNVTHCDGSARVQTVNDKWNSKFSKLIAEFYKYSGIAVLLNTSFNKKGMPIVETPFEAIELFKETALDILVIENTVIEKQTIVF
ncbi:MULTISPECIES: carbamoyltransferase C-terminal domain-containing protein [unclassified Flavobacterium]|uniref:carbamoyltransferase C-terminal domain-containing protein n=1 Tax=unclassified Flavobacterium TaxID=196869 RepID=UPI001291B400|nr:MULTISPECIES: carbamoyltransferase C-terminal domain-containing protein [unclassified Flavobacterium]MQP52197.1 transferase [Flavobacterium sp. LMO9]MQP62067.1 transferase [Flavobacterium sp. LMO6]